MTEFAGANFRRLIFAAIVAAVIPGITLPMPFTAMAQESQASDALWQTEDLPDSAAWRYGASQRETIAVGIHALKFSHDGKWIAARDRRQQVRILNLEQQRLQAIAPSRHVLDFAFSPDDKFIVTGDRKGSHLWRVSDGKLDRDLLEHPGFRIASDVPKNQLIIVGKGTRHVFSWPLPSSPKRSRTKLPGSTLPPLGVSKRGRLTIFSNGKNIEILDHQTDDAMPFPDADSPKRILFSPDGNLIADLRYGDSTLTVWDRRHPKVFRYLFQMEQRLVTAEFSSDSRFLYTSNWKNEITVWDIVTQQPILTLTGHTERIYALASSPQLFRFASGASGSSDRSVIAWDFQDRIFPELDLPTDPPIDFSLDDVWTELGSTDANISLAATNRLYRQLQQQASLVTTVTDRCGLNSTPDDSLARQLLEDLDASEFTVRETATQDLLKLVDQFRPLLEKFALNKSSPAEAKWRVKKILETTVNLPRINTAAGRRDHRLVLALELAGTEYAIDALQQFADVHNNPGINAVAVAALNRLDLQR